MEAFHHVFIAVMGMTGAGKSTLIKTLTDQEVRVGHGLHSCTGKMEDYFFQEGQFIVHLIDTPGFDDTTKSDTETLEEVATWLAATYRSQVRLTGILYLHRITDNRLGGCAMRNLMMFKKMCGQSCLPNVVLLTTMWGGSPEQISLQESREHELRTGDSFWAGLIRLGAQSKRYDGTAQCGFTIIKDMLTRPQIVLDIQRQIVDEGKNLNETAAGMQLREDLAKAEQKFKEELRQAKEEHVEALRKKDLETAEEMRKISELTEGKLRQVKSDKERLKEDLQWKLQQHQMILQLVEANQKMKWAILGGVAIGLVTGGLGTLASMAVLGGTGAVTTGLSVASGLAGLPVAQLAGELGRRAIMGATRGALQLGSTVLAEAGPQLAAQAIAAAIERDN